MKLSGSFNFEAPQDVVWRSLLDTDVLVSVMPGCDKLEEVGENEYEGVIKTKVGPVQGTFNCKFVLENIDEPNGYSMRIDGSGPVGVVNATASVNLEPEGDGTKMTYESDAKVGGRVASVGQRLLDTSAKAITKQSLRALNDVVKARAAGAGGDSTEEAQAPKGPTQAEFAAAVAKDVAGELVPPWMRLVLGAIVVAIIAYVIYAIIR